MISDSVSAGVGLDLCNGRLDLRNIPFPDMIRMTSFLFHLPFGLDGMIDCTSLVPKG
jgi:hypothetical protein